jgi:hypothetical protein
MKELEADGAPKALTDIDSISSAFKAASDDEKIEMAEQLQKIAREGATPGTLSEVFEYQRDRAEEVQEDLEDAAGSLPKQGLIPDWVPLIPKAW